MTRTILIALPLFLLAACNSQPAGNTATTMGSVEVEPGTISDSMIILDDAAGDGTAVDNSVPDDGPKKEASKPVGETADEEDTDGASDNSEAVEAPGGQRTAAPDAAAKKGE